MRNEKLQYFLGGIHHEKLHKDKRWNRGQNRAARRLPAGAGVPFVHSHKHNEEIYGVISGSGKAVIDGETVALTAGDWLRVAPAAKRQFSADAESGITFVCIQVKENSLDGFTADDAVVY